MGIPPCNLEYETYVSSMATCSKDSETLRFLRPRARHNDIFRPCTPHIKRNEVRDKLDSSKVSRSSTNEPSKRLPE